MRKNSILAMVAIMAVSFFFASCGSKSVSSAKSDATEVSEADVNTLAFDSIVVDTATQVVNGADTLKATVHISLPLAKGEGADAVNDSILSSGILTEDFMPKNAKGMTAEQKVRAFAKNFLDGYREGCKLAMSEGSVGASFQYSYDVTSKVTENAADSLVNVEMSGYVFMGGAHGSSISLVRNFDRATGAMIGKADLLKADGEKPVLDMICGELQKQFNVKSFSELKEEMGIFSFMDAYVPDNFIIKPDSITFIYQSDEIAPHAAGEIRTTFSKKQLAKCLKK